jgi:GMP reductase
MRIEDSVKLDYSDVLIRPKRSTLISRRDVTLEREFKFRHSDVIYKGVPIMAANMDATGTFEMARALLNFNMFTCIHKHYDMDGWKEGLILDTGPDPSIKNIAISTGISTPDFIKTSEVLAAFDEIQYICVDVANGYTENFVRFIRKMRKAFPTKVIIAGNVVTADMTEALILAGADVVKVGIGPGSVCTTRKKTGVGYPQLSAVIECADAAHGLKGLIVADGGCTCPGDVAKAFAAGSDFVMLGGMFAGHTEGGGKLIPGKARMPMIEFYGMSSATAQTKHGDGLTGYSASEGKRVLIPYKGDVAVTVKDILGGVRSACTYTGSPSLKELSKRTTFVRVNNQLNNVYGTTSEG